MRHSERISKYPLRNDPGFEAVRECKSDSVVILVYIIHNGDYCSNVDTYKIILLLDYWYSQYCMDTLSTLYMIESYALKYQSHYPDTLM